MIMITDEIAMIACIAAALILIIAIVGGVLSIKLFDWRSAGRSGGGGGGCSDRHLYTTLHFNEQWERQRQHNELIDTINRPRYDPPTTGPSELDKFWDKYL